MPSSDGWYPIGHATGRSRPHVGRGGRTEGRAVHTAVKCHRHRHASADGVSGRLRPAGQARWTRVPSLVVSTVHPSACARYATCRPGEVALGSRLVEGGDVRALPRAPHRHARGRDPRPRTSRAPRPRARPPTLSSASSRRVGARRRWRRAAPCRRRRVEVIVHAAPNSARASGSDSGTSSRSCGRGDRVEPSGSCSRCRCCVVIFIGDR